MGYYIFRYIESLIDNDKKIDKNLRKIILRQSNRSRKECHDIYIWITTMILRDGKRLIDDRKVSKRCLSSIRIIESETELENEHHCNSSDFFSPSTSPLFYFPRPVPRFIWHAIRVHLVSMKSKSIFSQITHASRLRFCDNTREYHFSPPSFSVFSFILSFILFIYFVSFEISLRNRKFIEGVWKWWSEAWKSENDIRWTICSFYKIQYHCLKNWKKNICIFFFSTRSFIHNKWIDPYWGMKRLEKHGERLSTALRHLFPIFSYNCKQLTKIRINNDGHVIIGFFF